MISVGLYDLRGVNRLMSIMTIKLKIWNDIRNDRNTRFVTGKTIVENGNR